MALPPPPSSELHYDPANDNPYLFDDDPEKTIEESDLKPEEPTETKEYVPYPEEYDYSLFSEEYPEEVDTYEPEHVSSELPRYEGEGFVEVEQVHHERKKFENDPTTWVDDFMYLAEGVYPFLLLVIGVTLCVVASTKLLDNPLQSRLFDLGQTIALVGTGANVKQITSSAKKN